MVVVISEWVIKKESKHEIHLLSEPVYLFRFDINY